MSESEGGRVWHGCQGCKWFRERYLAVTIPLTVLADRVRVGVCSIHADGAELTFSRCPAREPVQPDRSAS